MTLCLFYEDSSKKTRHIVLFLIKILPSTLLNNSYFYRFQHCHFLKTGQTLIVNIN